MTRTACSLAALLLFAGTIALAEQEASDPTVKAWQELMEDQGRNTKVLGDMAKGATPFDAAAAEAAKAALIADVALIPARFETKAEDPASEALPAIWDNFDDFKAKTEALTVALNALDTSSLETVQAGMAGVGAACGACHKAYRAD